MAVNYLAIHVEGLRVFAKQMRMLSPELAKALSAELRDIGDHARDKVRSSGARPYRTGRLRKSIKTSVTQRRVTLYSTLPQAPVWNFGGEIKPRGIPIRIPRTEFVTGAVKAEGEYVTERLGGLLEGMARRYAGFR